MATVPLADAAVALLLVSAPALLMPVPEIVSALLMLWPYRSSAAPVPPLETMAAPLPSAVALPSLIVPTLTVVPPL